MDMEWVLETALVILLAATLFHAIRLERALGVLKRDRAALEELIDTFNSSTRLAEQGIERLRTAADGAGRQIARQTEAASGLKDDLLFLLERGERVADQLDTLVRSARAITSEPSHDDVARMRSAPPEPLGQTRAEPRARPPIEQDDARMPRVRSQAERDLLKALRIAR
jgi:hypothetical protein